jgi:hypothetical protein
MWHELSDTLIALVESVQAPPEAGLVVTEVDLDIPLEAQAGIRNGELVIYGSVPHSRWVAGVLPPVSLGKLHVELLEDAPAPEARA